MKYTFTGIVAIGLTVFCVNSNAEIFIEGGLTKHIGPPNNLWNQDGSGYRSDKKLKSFYGRVGYSFENFDVLGTSAHVNISASHFGKGEIDSDAADDEPCATTNGTNSPHVCGSTQRYVAKSKAMAVSLSLDIKVVEVVSVEIGGSFMRREFSVETQKPGDQLCDRDDLLNTGKDHLYGLGYFAGVKFHIDNKHTLAGYVHTDNIGGGWPSGFSTMYVIGVGRSF